MADENGTPNEKNDGNEPGVLKMTQAELNAKMAENRRGLQKELTELKAKSQGFEQLQTQVSELLGSGLIDGVEDLAGFREKANETIRTFQTEKEKFEADAKKYKKDLETAQETAKNFTNRYNQAQISRSISDEAGSKVVSPGALELIQMKLAQASTVGDDGTVTVTLNVKDDDGKVGPKAMSVKDAISVLEADVSNYGTLFRSTVNSGTGIQVDGVKKAQDGTIDMEGLSFEKFLELQKKNPNLLEKTVAGLR